MTNDTLVTKIAFSYCPTRCFSVALGMADPPSSGKPPLPWFSGHFAVMILPPLLQSLILQLHSFSFSIFDFLSTLIPLGTSMMNPSTPLTVKVFLSSNLVSQYPNKCLSSTFKFNITKAKITVSPSTVAIVPTVVLQLIKSLVQLS